MARTCSICGGVIQDLLIHPAAHLCPGCRAYARGKWGSAIYQVRCTEVVLDYLNRNNWPQFTRALYIINTEPRIIADIGLGPIPKTKALVAKQRTSAKWAISGVLRRITGPDGQRYRAWSKTSDSFVLVEDTSERDEVTA